VSLNGLYVQYAGQGAAFAATSDILALPNVSVPSGGYFLVQAAAGAGNGSPLPTPDASANIAMSATNGKVALVTQPLNGCGTTATPCPTTNIVDFVGYGSAQQYEGSAAAPALTNTTAAHRKASGCIETDQNGSDFEAVAPAPKNSATTPAPCGAMDAGSDAATDAAADTGTDAATDVGSDAPEDTGSDAPADTGSDAPADTGSDAPVEAGAPPVGLVIAEIYGGSGNNAPYTSDYIELFNRGTAPASLAGVYVQYGSATGNFNATGSVALPNVTLQPGQYFLVKCSTGGGGGAAVPTPDATATINLGLGAGKVVLTFPAPLDACGGTTPCPTTNMLDLVGYGTTATQYEGSGAAPAPSIDNSAIRKQGGCQDTNDNANDFTVATGAPKNTQSPLHDCSSLPDSGTGGTGGAIDAAVGGAGGSGGAAGAGGAAGGGGSGGAAGAGGAAGGGASGGTGAVGGTGPTGGTGGTGGGGGFGAFDGGIGGGNSASGDGGGCGCETPGDDKPARGALLFAALGLALAARRKKS
jgi:MYXO-CTERM domain-containing protein